MSGKEKRSIPNAYMENNGSSHHIHLPNIKGTNICPVKIARSGSKLGLKLEKLELRIGRSLNLTPLKHQNSSRNREERKQKNHKLITPFGGLNKIPLGPNTRLNKTPMKERLKESRKSDGGNNGIGRYLGPRNFLSKQGKRKLSPNLSLHREYTNLDYSFNLPQAEKAAPFYSPNAHQLSVQIENGNLKGNDFTGVDKVKKEILDREYSKVFESKLSQLQCIINHSNKNQQVSCFMDPERLKTVMKTTSPNGSDSDIKLSKNINKKESENKRGSIKSKEELNIQKHISKPDKRAKCIENVYGQGKYKSKNKLSITKINPKDFANKYNEKLNKSKVDLCENSGIDIFEEEVDRLDKLTLLNVGARVELLDINQQILDFDLNLNKLKQKRDKKLRLGNNESLPTLDTAKDPMLNSEYEFNKALYENPVSLIQKGVCNISPIRFSLKLPQ